MRVKGLNKTINKTRRKKMNYYTFDRIEKDGGCHWGYRGDDFCEVFDFSSDDTEEQLEKDGFAKCDAPDWDRTMVVEEADWKSLSKNG